MMKTVLFAMMALKFEMMLFIASWSFETILTVATMIG